MIKHALIKDGVVTNVIIWDGIAEADMSGALAIDISDMPTVGPGCIYDAKTNTFTDPTIIKD